MDGANPQIPGYYSGPPVNPTPAEQAATAALEQKDGNQQPQGSGYYVGQPANARQPPAAAEQNGMTPDPPGYYKGRPVKPGKPPAVEPRRAEPNFFAKCFACFSSSGNA